MDEYVVKITSIEQITHDVKQFRFEKPAGYFFNPGQATDVSINTPALRNELRPFTFTCLNSEKFLEFTIKIYPEHKGITNELGKLNPGSELIIRDVWGDIAFKGKGLFIAGGAGITPFISIFRDLNSKGNIAGNILVFANKTKNDIILESELNQMLGKSFLNILSDEENKGYFHGYITEEFLKTNIPVQYKNYYLCGPPPMMEAVLKELSSLGVEDKFITMEKM